MCFTPRIELTECVDVLAKAHTLAQPYGNVTYDA